MIDRQVMPTLSVQFQPERAKRPNVKLVQQLMCSTAIREDGIRGFDFHRGHDRGLYINFNYQGSRDTLARLWKYLKTKVLLDRRAGAQLRQATIITCEGSRGWENYRLLYHFNPKTALDSFPGE